MDLSPDLFDVPVLGQCSKTTFITWLEVGSSKPSTQELPYKTLRVFAERDSSCAGHESPEGSLTLLGVPLISPAQ